MIFQLLGLAAQSAVLSWLLKATLLLVIAWAIHFCLLRANPHWRVFLWRATGVALSLLVLTSVFPYQAKIGFVTTTIAVPESLEEESDIAKSLSKSTASLDVKRDLPTPELLTNSSEFIDPLSASAVTEQQPTSSGAYEPRPVNRRQVSNWRALLVRLWQFGWLFLLMRLMIGGLLIRQMVARANEAPSWVTELSANLTKRMELPQVVVRSTPRITAPLVCGMFRKTILLPDALCTEAYRREMRSILSHELAHVRGRDLAWNWLLHLVTSSLWFHPAIWRIRAAHVTACELVADIESATAIGDTNAYRRTLALVALQANGTPLTGFTMARSSNVRRRIQMLPQMIRHQHLRRSVLAISIAATIAAVIAIGGLRVVFAQQTDEASTDERTATEIPKGEEENKFTVLAVDPFGKPVPNLELSASFGGRGFGKIDHEEGRATIEVNRVNTEYFAVRARAPGYVPFKCTWRQVNKTRPIPREFTFQMEFGTTIGCTITNEKGEPIAGATVRVLVPGNETNLPRVDIWDHQEETDELGRWQCDIVPAKLKDVWLRLEHPDYVSDSHYGATPKPSLDQLRDLSGKMEMKKGITLTGTVVDENGNVLAGVDVFQGDDRFGSHHPSTTTNLDGQFSFPNCKPGLTVLTITQPGFSPELRRVNVVPTIEPLHIELKQGKRLTVKVVDADGNPLGGVWMAADTWRQCRSLCDAGIPRETDARGNWSWNWAPDDPVEFDILKRGFMTIRNEELIAREKPYQIILKKPLTLSGRVTDKETGKPIDSFSLVRGRESGGSSVSWNHRSKKDFQGGAFEFKTGEPQRFVLRVIAEAYLPARSRWFDTNGMDNGDVSYHFELQRGIDIDGMVLTPEMKPALEAEVALAFGEQRGARIRIQDGRFQRETTVVQTNQRGEFRFPPVENDYVLIVQHESGFAEVTRKQLEASNRIQLVPWAVIEGISMTGREIDPERRLNVGRVQTVPIYSVFFNVRTDREGRFRLTRVPPNMAFHVAKAIDFGRSTMYSHGTTVHTQGGQVHRIQIGGTGRPLIGKVVVSGTRPGNLSSTNVSALTGSPPPPGNYQEMSQQDQQAWRREWAASTPLHQRQRLNRLRFPVKLRGDGTFRIDDVPAGHYLLDIAVSRKDVDIRKGGFLGRVQKHVEVKPMENGRSDKAQLLGILRLSIDNQGNPTSH